MSWVLMSRDPEIRGIDFCYIGSAPPEGLPEATDGKWMATDAALEGMGKGMEAVRFKTKGEAEQFGMWLKLRWESMSDWPMWARKL